MQRVEMLAVFDLQTTGWAIPAIVLEDSAFGGI